jgi:hypothetical protein
MALSIPMMCIQTPGSFVFAASLAARLGAEGWSSWGMFVVTGCLQGCLLGMGISFELRDRRRKRDEQRRRVHPDAQDENSTLIGSDNGHVSNGAAGGYGSIEGDR